MVSCSPTWRPTRWVCWRWSQAKMSNRAISTGHGGSPSGSRQTGRFRSSIPKPGICTRASANTGDGPAGVALLTDEEPGLQVLADSAYGGGETRACLRSAGHEQAIKAIPLRRAVPGGFDRDDFIVDHDARTVTCLIFNATTTT